MTRHVLAVAVCALLPGCGGGGTPVGPRSPAPSPPPAPSPSPLASADGWELLAGSPDSPPDRRHDDLVLLDDVNGWLVNTLGQVHRTHDGGETWQQLAQVEVPLRCVGFASLTRGWAGNINLTNSPLPDVALYETEDGGRTWANISTRITGVRVVGLCGMRVLGPRTVVAVGRWSGPPVFVRTDDGGRTWTSRSLAPLASGLIDLHFFNEQDGLAVGGLGVGPAEAQQRASRTVILATADGGATWETRYTSANAGEWAWKVHFVDDRVGYVTTEGPTPEGVVVKTTNGGRTWQRLPVARGLSFEGVAFVSADRGWVGAFQTLYATANGGLTWTPLQFGTRVNRMRVTASGRVYAAGSRVYRWTP